MNVRVCIITLGKCCSLVVLKNNLVVGVAGMMWKRGIRGCSGDENNGTLFHLIQKGYEKRYSTVDSP